MDSNLPILDLSQRTTTNAARMIDNWSNDSPCEYTDAIDEIRTISMTKQWNIEQSLTDQLEDLPMKEDSMSDSSTNNQSKLDLYSSFTQKPCSSHSRLIIHELSPCSNSSPSNFLWSKYLSTINERSVSDEFFDHYLTSLHSGFEINMKLEYCYDTQRDLYWLTQVQLVSHCLLLLHFIGIPEEDTSNDFWAYVYEQRCHPIGWCRENSKLMLPPPIVTKRAVQSTAINNHLMTNGNDKQTGRGENEELQTPPSYLFKKEIGLNPSEQLKTGMLLEIQDLERPWTLWFVRILNNRGGRLHLRYIIHSNQPDAISSDIHLFYLDWRVHFIGWCSKDPSIYSYDPPSSVSLSLDKQAIIDSCLKKSNEQFLPSNLFREQEEIRKHRFTEGMKLEIFDAKTQNIYVGQIGRIHNEYYFDTILDNEHQSIVVGHATHPHLLPPNWATEHRLALMKGKGVRQSEDYWHVYTEKNGKNDLVSERCFNLLTLNSTGNNRAEPGMKMEMISTLNNEDYVVAVTLIFVIDHLMWLRIDNRSLCDDEHFFYHVLPINSLEVFPVGWAKFNGFQFLTPLEYRTQIHTYEQNRYELFSSVTHYPKIPRVYFNEIYQLTLYVNIRCFSGPHLCSSRLARIPSQFGPGPFRHVLIDMFHYLLSAASTSTTNTLRALRRLEHSSNSELKTEYIKAAKRAAKLIRPISLPTNPYLIHQYLRHVCTQLETCPNFISMKHWENHCPDKCHILINTFALSIHSKHKRTQLRTAQNRQRKQKSLLCHLKPNPIPTPPPVDSTPVVEEILPTDSVSELTINDVSPPAPPPPGSDRKTRGFRVHIEPRTHTVTRTNKKQKLTVKQEPMEVKEIIAEPSSSIPIPIKDSKRSRVGKMKRSSPPLITTNILSNPSSPTSRTKKKRRASPIDNDFPSSSDVAMPKLDIQPPAIPMSLIDTRNPVTWNVNDVCSYLNQSGCSFALKTIKEQEIDGAALLLLDNLRKVQDLLEFKLGPAVKFCHVVEQLRTQVIDTFHSSPSLKTSRFSTTNTS